MCCQAQPLVSILIPAYNAERWIAATIESVLAQTWPHKEIIIVDDGSTDNTLAVVKRFDSEITKVINQSKTGAAAARNAALAKAQGELIQYLDSDDILAPDKIVLQVQRLVAEPHGAVATGSWARFYNGNISGARFPDHADFRDYSSPVDWLILSWNGRGTMPPVSWLLPRTVVEKAGPWNEKLSLNDDTEYFTRAALASSKICFCPEARGYYRSGNASLSARRDRKAIESYFLVCQLCTEELLAFEDSARTRGASAGLWQFFAYQTYPDAPDLVRLAEAKVTSLGGASLELKGSLMFRFVQQIAGWKTAKRMQRAYYSLRYASNDS